MKGPDTVANAYRQILNQSIDPALEREKKKKMGRRWRKLSITLRNRWTLCQNPGCECPSASVHHIRSAYAYPELFYTEKNLIPLCDSCHRKADVQILKADDELADYWEKKIYERHEKKQANKRF